MHSIVYHYYYSTVVPYDVIYVNYVKYKGHVNYVILNVPDVPDVNEISILNRKLQKKHAF